MNSAALSELQQLVEAALARHGVAGEVRVDATTVTLVGSGPTVTADIESLAHRWNELSLAERQHHCALLARTLTRSRRLAQPGAPRPRSRPYRWLGLVALLASGGATYAWRASGGGLLRPRVAVAVKAPEQHDRGSERAARAERVCNATRTRLARGATVGPTDAEGWVVELSLLRQASAASWRPLAGFVTGAPSDEARLDWSGAPELGRLSGPNTKVEVRQRQLPESGPAEYRELTLTLHGEYVLPYFREAERIKLVRFAHALGEKQSAELGALYARCASGDAHHMGAWFLGTSPGAAASALLYYMAAHAQPPLLPADLLSASADGTLEPAFALGTLLQRTQRWQRQEVASGIAAQDGMVAGPPAFTTLGFPFVDSDRALRASYALARVLPETRPAQR